MSITTLDGLIASAKQRVRILKTASRTSVATSWESVFDLAGDPGAGTLAGTSTTTGVVPTDATTGTPIINAFGGGASGYLSSVEFASPVACRIMIFDLLWKGGAYAFNANTSAQTPTSYSSRIPVSGTDWSGTELWLEQVTAGTLVQNVAVTYNNQAGSSQTTGTVATGTNIVGRMFPLPLAAGDSGVQGVTGVVGSTASAGTFNILVIRPLWTGRVPLANGGDLHDYLRVGLPVVFADSALCIAVCTDAAASSLPEVYMTIVNG